MSDWTWDLARLDAGELSVLRKAAGTVFSQADVSAIRVFYKACGHCYAWQEEYMFPAMCMDALWRMTDDPTVKPFAEGLRIMTSKDQNTTASIKHRIDSLLETPWDDNGFMLGKLLNLVRLLKSNTGLKPDFQALANDLNGWNHPKRYVQRNWLRTIYNSIEDNVNEEDKTNVD